MRNLILFTVAAIFFILSCNGCNESGWNYTSQQPKQEDLVGTYYPDQRTLNYVRQEQRYIFKDMAILLRANGTFRLNNIPDLWNSGKNQGRFNSGGGEWHIEQNDKWWVVKLDIKWDNRGGQVNNYAHVVGQEPPYKLNLGIGDPDQGEALEFSKQKISP